MLFSSEFILLPLDWINQFCLLNILMLLNTQSQGRYLEKLFSKNTWLLRETPYFTLDFTYDPPLIFLRLVMIQLLSWVPWFNLHCLQAFYWSIFVCQLLRTIGFMAPFLLESIGMQEFLSQLTIKHYQKQMLLLILSIYSASKLCQSCKMNIFYIWNQDLLYITHVASNLELIWAQLF